MPDYNRDVKFSQLSQSEDWETFLPNSPPFSNTATANTQRLRWNIRPYVYVLLGVVVLACASATSFCIGRQWKPDSVKIAGKISRYSPVLEDVPLIYTLQTFNGSLLKPNKFRHDASPEVDAAWASLGVNYRPLSIPSNLAQKSGLANDQVKINQKYGGGYPANVEGLHHLHCLNILRQSLYFNYQYYHSLRQGAFVNEDYVVKLHVTHCLDILRQQLMCTIDVGVLGQVWIHPESPESYVDFNTRHMCRDFEGVRRWAEERQMPDVVPEDWLQPPEERDRIYEEMP